MNILNRAKRTCGRIIRRVKKVAGKANGWKYRKQGFSWDGVDQWNEGVECDLKSQNGVSKAQKLAMHKLGYYSWHLAQKGFSMDRLQDCISDKDYAYLRPFNSIYAKYVNDAITFRYVLPSTEHLFKYDYQMIRRDGRMLIVKLADLEDGYGTSLEEVFRLLRDKKTLVYAPSRGKNNMWYILQYEDGEYLCNGVNVGEFGIKDEFMANCSSMHQLMEYPGQHSEFDTISHGKINRLRLTIINEHGDDPIIADARMVWDNAQNQAIYTAVNLDTGVLEDSYVEFNSWLNTCTVHPDTEQKLVGAIPDWEKIKTDVKKTSLSLREAEYFSMDILIAKDGFYYLSFDDYPALPKGHVPGKPLQEYLMRKLAYKKSQPVRKLITKKTFESMRDILLNKMFCERGFARFWATEWSHSMLEDLFKYHGVTLKEKIWCYKRGFLSYHKVQYGLTEENWQEYISDYHYKWLYPINNSFFDWIDDKATYRYIMEPLKQYAPEYYYHLVKRSGKLCIIPMGDCPAKYGADMESILGLLREKGALALKQSSGSHGDGFFKLSYADGQYFMNNKPSSEEEIEERLNTLSCFYVLTEFLVMHEELRKIYSETVNTIRVMAINRNGQNPKIMNAYMRIGAASTGLTDNIGYGGIFCKIDKDTGHYYDAEQSKDHVIVSCPKHPDTGVLIEGQVPMWDEACKAVLDICNMFPQLEYLGFDVAVTDRGIKILEVNKHQDLHRCNLYGPEIQKYYKEKIALKREILKSEEIMK